MAFPRQFGAYVLQRRLGVGGMAETFIARRQSQQGVEQLVCLKRVLPAFNEDANFVRQFQREAKIAGRLRHSNIVGILDFGQVGNEQFMALELVDGVDLRGLLSTLPGGRLDPELAALVALDLAYALEYAHEAEARIVHRDVTPSNVLLSTHGEVKLADFGVAKALTGATVATATGFVKGKVPYMAPEQMRGGDIDGRVDLFALGVTLFEALAGRRPFVGQHDVEVMMNVLESKRPTLRSLVPDVPEPLAELVEKLLSAEASERPANAGEVVDALAPVITNASRSRDALAELVREAYGSSRGADSPDTSLALAAALPAVDPLAGTAMGDAPVRRVVAPVARANKRGWWIALIVALLIGAAGLAAVASPDAEATPLPAQVATPTAPTDEQPTLPRGAALPELPTIETAAATEGEETPRTAMAEVVAPVEVEPSPSPVPEAIEDPPEPSVMRATMRASEGPLTEIRVTVVPWGKVWVRGREVGRAPQVLRLPVGRHVVRAGYDRPSQSETVVIHSGDEGRSITIELPDR